MVLIVTDVNIFLQQNTASSTLLSEYGKQNSFSQTLSHYFSFSGFFILLVFLSLNNQPLLTHKFPRLFMINLFRWYRRGGGA